MAGLQLRTRTQGPGTNDAPSAPAPDALTDPLAAAEAAQIAGTGQHVAERPSGGPLPHLGKISASFGKHDISGVQAHTGDAATEATRAAGAKAFTSPAGVTVGAGGGDLHTIAHEAAHVVQQQQGITLPGGVGQAGDAHEKQADAVADKVVKGESAESLLDETVASAGSDGGLQLKPDGPGGNGNPGGSDDPTKKDNLDDGKPNNLSKTSGTPNGTPKDDPNGDKKGSGGGGGGGNNPTNTNPNGGPNGDATVPDPAAIQVAKPEPADAISSPDQKEDGKGDPPPLDVSEPRDATFVAPKPTPLPTAGTGVAAVTPPPIIGGSTIALINPAAGALVQIQGMNIKEHAAENLAAHRSLHDQAVKAEQDFLNNRLAQIMADTGMTIDQLRADATATNDAAMQGLLGSYDQMIGTLGLSADEATARLDAAKATLSQDLAALAAEKSAEVKCTFEASIANLEKQEVKWGGSVEKTLTAAAAQMQKVGEEYALYAESMSDTSKGNAKAAAGSKGSVPTNTSNAIVEAQEKSKVDAYKKHAPLFRQYATLAVQRLRDMAGNANPLAEEIHAPGIDQLFPLSDDYRKQLMSEVQTFDKDASNEVRRTIKAIETLKAEQTAIVQRQQSGSKALNNEQMQTLTTQLIEIRKVIEQKAESETAESRAALQDGLVQIAEMRKAISGTPNSVNLQNQLNFMTMRLSERMRAAGEAIQTDSKKANDAVTAQADEKKTALKDNIAAHEVKVGDATKDVVTTISDATDKSADNLNTNLTNLSGNVGDVMKGTRDDVKTANADAINQSADYQMLFVAKVQDFVHEAQANLDTLKGKMEGSAGAKAQAAGDAEHDNLRGRTKNIWKAIDRWGTDEAGLLENLMGLSPAEAGYIITVYPQFHKGFTIWKAITEDTSEGDNVRNSAFAYLQGDPATGAMFAQLYATDRWSNWFGSNTDLIKKSMTSLTEEQRTEMMNDPDFPEIKAAITMQLQNDGLFGANSYDIDTYQALTDATLTQKQSLQKADAIELSEAFNGNWYNPFSWGTDEATVYKVLEKWQGEDLASFNAVFTSYNGSAIEYEVNNELSGNELGRGKALAENNKGKADAYALEMALDNGDSKEANKVLGDTKLTDATDLVDRAEALKRRQTMNETWDKELKGKSKAANLEEHITNKLGGSKSKDAYADEIAIANLQGKKAAPEHLLAHAILNGNADSAEAVAAIAALKAQLTEATPEAAKKRWAELKKWFQSKHGITNLEKYLGIGEHKYETDKDDFRHPGNLMLMTVSPGLGLAAPFLTKGDKALDGQDAHDLDMAVMDFLKDEGNVNSLYKIAYENYQWYRGKGANAVGSWATDLYAGSGERLDEVWKELQTLYADTTWFDAKTGAPKADDAAKKRLARFQDRCKLLNDVADVYKDHRNEVTDAIVNTIMTVTAIVATIFTGPLGAMLLTAAGGMLSIAVKGVMKGKAYGKKELRDDIQAIVKDTVKSLISMGMAKYAKMSNWLGKLEKAAETSKKAKFLAELSKSLPSDLFAALADEKAWKDPNAFFAAVTGASFRTLAGKGSEVYGGDMIAKHLDNEGGKFLSIVFNKYAEVNADIAAGSVENVVEKGSIDIKKSNKEMKDAFGGIGTAAVVDYTKDRTKLNWEAHQLSKQTSFSAKDVEDYQGKSNADKAMVDRHLTADQKQKLSGTDANQLTTEEVHKLKAANAQNTVDAKQANAQTPAVNTAAVKKTDKLALLNTGTAEQIKQRWPNLTQDKIDLLIASRGSGYTSMTKIKDVKGIGDGTMKVLRN